MSGDRRGPASADDEPVGYCRPPSWTRFKPGRSGNPKGRPKKSPTIELLDLGDTPSDAILRAELSKKRRYKEGGTIKVATTSELVTRATAEAALKGNALAQRDFDRQRRELEKSDRERARLAQEAQEEDFKRMVAYRECQARAYAEASEDEADAFALGPHPDDILLDFGKMRWKVRGPIGPDDLTRFECYRAARDASYLRSVVYRRTCKSTELKQASLPELTWFLYEELLPKRWQLRHVDLFEANHFWQMIIPMRQLRVSLREAEKRAEELRAKLESSFDSPEGYRVANAVMKPVLKQFGYRSLAQFEDAYERSGGKLKLEKRKSEVGAR